MPIIIKYVHIRCPSLSLQTNEAYNGGDGQLGTSIVMQKHAADINHLCFTVWLGSVNTVA